MWIWRRKKDFVDLINPVKVVKIHGIKFSIRKINVLDYLEGAKVMAETFSTYKGKDAASFDTNDFAAINKLKKYVGDIILAGCVHPKFSRDENPTDDAIPISTLFNDWVLTQKLSQAIFDYTNGKKK